MATKRVLFTTKWICYVAVLTAMVVATGYIPRLPVLTGYIYWCDFAIFMAAYLLDPIGAAIVGGIGTAFFDLFGINGTAYTAIPSLLIHGAQGFAVSGIFMLLRFFFNKKESEKREIVLAVLAGIFPALLVIVSYYLKRITWDGLAPAVAIAKMPANVLQEVIGLTVAIVILYVCKLKKQLKAAHLLPDFRLEMIGKRKTVPPEPSEQPEKVEE
ncbi:MAG: ECF transporter S component [Clostridia bacterium]|nr:ECF transporter S component [Clostridia bacterium]